MPRITDIQRMLKAIDAAPGKKLTVAALAQALNYRPALIHAKLEQEAAKAVLHLGKGDVVTKRRAPRKAKDQQAGQEQLALPYQDGPAHAPGHE